jgi:phosphoribosyl 1,2-cyclic phosphodiesterase
LIFLDIMMPKIDGFTLCRQLREVDTFNNSKIVFVSAKKFDVDKRMARELGADGYLEKPFQTQQLTQKARSMLQSNARIKFWGTRGSIATPSHDTVVYGGNTSCVELYMPDREELFILDAGTGLRELGNRKLNDRRDWNGYIFITHTHWDHIQGLPFFMPAYIPGNNFTIVSADQPNTQLEEIISGQMQSTYFPVDFSSLGAKMHFLKVFEGEYTINKIRVETMLANHPNVTLMFKFHLPSGVVVYATDNELEKRTASGIDPMAGNRERMIEFFRGADVLIHDAQYNEAEYKIKRGWGHSTWNEALDIAVLSEVKKLILFHHDPDHTDEWLDRTLDECGEELDRRAIDLTFSIAKEGEDLEL